MSDQVVQIKYFYKSERFPVEKINYLYLIYVTNLDETVVNTNVLSTEIPEKFPTDAPILIVVGKKVVILVPIDTLSKMSLDAS